MYEVVLLIFKVDCVKLEFQYNPSITFVKHFDFQKHFQKYFLGVNLNNFFACTII